MDEDIKINKTFSVKKFDFNSKFFLKSSILLYGPSKSGKTTMIRNILYSLRNDIKNILVFSTTAKMDIMYTSIMNPKFIHENISDDAQTYKKDKDLISAAKVIKNILDIQKKILDEEKKYVNTNSILKLYLKTNKKNNEKLIKLYEKKEKCKDECKLKEILEKIITLMKYEIKSFDFSKSKLNEDELKSVNFIKEGTNLLLLFDDYGHEMRALTSLPIFKRLFYQNRHFNITLIVSSQDDTNICADCRKNGMINIYTTLHTAGTVLSRPTSGLYMKKVILDEALEKTFIKENRKLIYTPLDCMFYHAVAKMILPDFHIGPI